MHYSRQLWSASVMLAFLLSCAVNAQDLVTPRQKPSPEGVEEAGLTRLAQDFYAAYAKKDLDGFAGLWSAKAPDFTERKKAMQDLFAAHDSIEVKNLTINKMMVDREKASVRVAVEISALEAKTGKPAADFGKMKRALHFVREDKAWKVWREASAEEDLAAALVEAATEDKRAALLATEKELVTAGLWRALIAQGDDVRLQGDYARALSVYALAQTIAEQIGDKSGIARALNGTGVVYQLQSNYSRALEYHQKSLWLAEAVGDKAGIAASLANFGLINKEQGNYDLALEYFQKSLKLREEVDKTRVPEMLLNIANVYYAQGDYDLALRNYRKALTQFEAAGDKWKSAVALNNLGVVYQDRGNYALALQHLQKGLALREAVGHKEGIAGALGNIGNTHFYQGNYGLALEYYRRSLKLNEELGNKADVARQMHNIGGVHSAQGKYKLALEDYQKSRTQREALGDKAGVAQTLNEIGNAYRLQSNWDQALKFYRESLASHEALNEKSGTAEALLNIGLVQHAQGNYSEALETTLRAADIARHIGARETLWAALTTRGRTYCALHRPAEARHTFEEAIAIIEELRTEVAGGEQEQERYFEKKISPYHAMVELLISQNEPGEALSYAERAKARVLLQVLQAGRVRITKAMTAQEQEQERRLQGDLVSLNTQINGEKQREKPDVVRLSGLNVRLEKARLDYEGFTAGLYTAHPELKLQRGETQPLGLQEIGALLPDAKSAVLEYVIAEDKTYLFVLTKGDGASPGAVNLQTYTLAIKKKDLVDRAEAFRKQLSGRDLSFHESARGLYDLLLGPARAQLEGKETLIIVPDGALWELPFQALQSAKDRHLLDDHAVSYVPSLSVLREMVGLRRKQFNNSPATLLAIGNPALGKETLERVELVHRDEKLEPLPEAEGEVKALAQLYGAEHSTVYVGAEAREDRVKAEAGKFKVLHLATHGILNDASPMYSQLVMAQGVEGTSEDGLLEAWELMNLDLTADLVVLSACETGRGRVGAGEGMIGLTWALFVAGSPTTVVSQWKVESGSTTELMVEFHRQLRATSGIGAAEALRQAALKQMHSDKYWHPFYWASFVVIGAGS